MRESRNQTPSLAHADLADPEWGTDFHLPLAPSRRSLPGLLPQPPRQLDRVSALEHSR